MKISFGIKTNLGTVRFTHVTWHVISEWQFCLVQSLLSKLQFVICYRNYLQIN